MKHKMPKQSHVNAVGIEFEGAWDKWGPIESARSVRKLLRKQKPRGLKYDGSINVAANTGGWVGEIASKPMQPRAIKSWVRRNKPDKQNQSCGTHVHLSIKTNHAYSMLTEKSFYDKYMSKMAKWARTHEIKEDTGFWKRYRGDNTYCKKQHTPELQIFEDSRNPNRYAHINYCYGLHKTLEFRMLPVFNCTDLMTDSIIETLRIVETYLATAPPIKSTWDFNQEYETAKNIATIYSEEAKPSWLNNHHTDLFTTGGGWLTREALELTGKQQLMSEYIVNQQNKHLVPENIPKTSRVISVERHESEERDPNTLLIYTEREDPCALF